jgi:hypothetical protein
MATTSPAVSLAIDETQATTPFSISAGSSAANAPVERIVRRDTRPQRKERFQPFQLVLAVIGYVVPAFGSAQHRRNGDQKNFFQQMFSRNSEKYFRGIVHPPFLTISASLHIAIDGHLYASALRAAEEDLYPLRTALVYYRKERTRIKNP